MGRQDLEIELIAAERRFRQQRKTTLEAGRKPMRQVRPYLWWMLPATGLVMGYAFGRVVRHRMLPAIWYAGSVSFSLLLAGLRWQN